MEDIKQQLRAIKLQVKDLSVGLPDDFIEPLAQLIHAREEAAAKKAELQRLDTGKHVAFQIIDGVSAYDLHAAFAEQIVKLQSQLKENKEEK